MSSNRSSRVLLVVSAVVLAAGVVGGVPVGGDVAGVTADVPERAEVGEEVSVTTTFNQSALYDRYDQWTLRGTTELTNVTWTVVGFDAADREVNRVTYPQDDSDGQQFEHPVDIEDDVVTVEVEIQATVPEATDYNYSSPQQLVVAEFTQVKGTNTRTMGTFSTHPYTNESQEARDAIARAEEAVNASNDADARDTLGDAISFFEGGQFQEAIDAAERAENAAEQSQQQNQLMQTLVYVVVGLVVVGLVVGGLWWYRKSQQASRL